MAGFTGSLKEQCEESIKHFKTELSRMRTGRAQSSLLEGIMVDYYGSPTSLIQLGMINAPEPRMITVQVYDQGAVEAVEKAIRQADLGLNPSRDGGLIRINIPSLTEDRRKELVKKLHKTSEEAKIAIRNHRRDQIDVLKKQEKEKKLSTDDLRRGQEEVQKLTDKYTADVDVLLQAKEKEITEV
jgi:ribosome recycling factor